MSSRDFCKKNSVGKDFVPKTRTERGFFAENTDSVAGLEGMEGQILASLGLGVAVFDRDLRLVYSNAAGRRWMGAGRDVSEVLRTRADARICGDWGEMLREVIAGRSVSFAAVAFRQGDEKATVNIRCMQLEADGLGVITIEDITERFAADAELAQNERLTALGRIAGKVAHELNNPMDGILRYIGLTGRAVDLGDSDKAKEYLERSRTGLLRMAGIIRQLLEFSRKTYSTSETAAVTDIAAEAVRSLERFRGEVEVEIRTVAGSEPSVRAGNLYQVFCNIIKNAFDAMGGAGRLSIEVRVEGELLKVAFADTGPGLDAETRGNIFKPFFTTKPAGKGTGLGLCVCKELVVNLGGEIDVDNNAGGGSTFTVKIPVGRVAVE